LEQYSKFFDRVNVIAKKLNEWITSGEIIYIISNYEADGIAASATLIKLIVNLEGKFHLRFIDYIDKEWVIKYTDEFKNRIEEGYFIFLDIGSTTLHYLNKFFPHNKVIVLDNDYLRSKSGSYDLLYFNLDELNIDGESEISTSGITYYVARAICQLNVELGSSGLIEDLLPFGIIGALGDNQDKGEMHGLLGLNKLILDDCKELKLIDEQKGPRFFRQESHILNSLLETIEPYLNGLTNNKKAVSDLLIKLNIPLNITLKDLNNQKISELNSELIKYTPARKDIVGINYIFLKEMPKSVLRDAREYAILLNACGRLNFPSTGLRVCLGDRGTQLREATNLYKKYRDSITFYLDWISTPDNLIEKSLIQCILGDSIITNRLIIPIISIALKNHILNPNKIVIGYLQYKQDVNIVYGITPFQGENKKINIWEVIKQTNKKLKIDTKTIGNRKKAIVKISNKINIKEYLDILESIIKKQIE